MTARSTRWTDPRYEFFIRREAPQAGWHSRKLWELFQAEFGQEAAGSLNAFRQFSAALRDGRHIEVPRSAAAAAVTDEALAQALESERKRMLYERDRQDDRWVIQTKVLSDALVEAACKVIPTIRPAKVPRLSAPAVDGKSQTGLLVISDTHVGAVADLAETGGFGEYNYEVFRRRLKTLQNKVRSITAHHRRSHPVGHLVAPLLGDLIENVDIFPAQGEMVDLDLMAQVFAAIEDLAEFYVGLLDSYETIFIPVVTGNHGRIGKKGQHKRHINWDYLIGKVLQYKLSSFADRISIEVPKAPFLVVDVEGFKFLLRHGDGIKSWGGIPYYGIQRSTGRWIAIQAAVGSHFDYMVMGHFHSPAHLPFTGGEVIINGCFPGVTEYSVEVIEALNEPSQFFGFVHPDYGLGARYPILLDGRARRRAA